MGSSEQDRQWCVHINVTLWRIRLTVVAVETQQCVLRIVELNLAVNNIKIPSVAQQCFHGDFMSLVIMKRT